MHAFLKSNDVSQLETEIVYLCKLISSNVQMTKHTITEMGFQMTLYI